MMKRICFTVLFLIVMLSALACDGAEGVTTSPTEGATVTLWEGDYEIGYQSAVDWINFLPFQAYRNATFSVYGTFNATFTTDADGSYEGAFASNANITAIVDGASFKVYNRHPSPIHITRIDLHLN